MSKKQTLTQHIDADEDRLRRSEISEILSVVNRPDSIFKYTESGDVDEIVHLPGDEVTIFYKSYRSPTDKIKSQTGVAANANWDRSSLVKDYLAIRRDDYKQVTLEDSGGVFSQSMHPYLGVCVGVVIRNDDGEQRWGVTVNE